MSGRARSNRPSATCRIPNSTSVKPKKRLEQSRSPAESACQGHIGKQSVASQSTAEYRTPARASGSTTSWSLENFSRLTRAPARPTPPTFGRAAYRVLATPYTSSKKPACSGGRSSSTRISHAPGWPRWTNASINALVPPAGPKFWSNLMYVAPILAHINSTSRLAPLSATSTSCGRSDWFLSAERTASSCGALLNVTIPTNNNDYAST